MRRRTKVWLTVAVVFGVVNAAGAVMAAIAKEPVHAMTHVALAIIGAYVAGALVVAARRPVDVPRVAGAELESEQLAHLELSLEGLAVGVERMGQGQRFVSRLFATRHSHPEPRNDVGSE